MGEDYFEHLLEEIREIRISEHRFCQKVTDIYKEFAESEFEKYRINQDHLFESDFDKLVKSATPPFEKMIQLIKTQTEYLAKGRFDLN